MNVLYVTHRNHNNYDNMFRKRNRYNYANMFRKAARYFFQWCVSKKSKSLDTKPYQAYYIRVCCVLRVHEVLPVGCGGQHHRRPVALQSPTATLIPLFQSRSPWVWISWSMGWKICRDTCHEWELNPRFLV